MSLNTQDVGFIHDLSSLDALRQQALQGDSENQEALHAAAKQFESIFTNMLFQSMRDANSGFESDLFSSQNQSFYRQMLDEQMSSELSSNGSLGLADMIVKQLQAGQGSIESHQPTTDIEVKRQQFQSAMRSSAAMSSVDELLASPEGKTIYNPSTQWESFVVPNTMAANQAPASIAPAANATPAATFDTPKQFVSQLTPYAKSAAKVLGVEPSLLIAQAALETGWGKKVINNGQGSSHNLFNIKADRAWNGDRMTKRTLEYHNNIPVTETAAFRSYDSFQQSFEDYVAFLQRNPRYDVALSESNSSEQFIEGIHQAGYATDPKYSDKVLSIKKRIDNM